VHASDAYKDARTFPSKILCEMTQKGVFASFYVRIKVNPMCLFSGKFGLQTGKFGLETGKFGLETGKFGLGTGKFGLGALIFRFFHFFPPENTQKA
jgi:hypothetical protein